MIFVCIIVSGIALLMLGNVSMKYFNKLKKIKKEKEDNEVVLGKEELTSLEFENKLFEEYKNICFKLLKKQIQACKVLDEVKKNIDEYSLEAKKCKNLYINTKDLRYKENAYVFLQEIDNAQKIYDLAHKTINECKVKIDSAELEYKTVISKIRNKQFEYKLIGDDADREFVDKSTYESILSDYTNKIDIKRIDSEVDDAIKKQNSLALEESSFVNTDEMHKLYEERFKTL